MKSLMLVNPVIMVINLDVLPDVLLILGMDVLRRLACHQFVHKLAGMVLSILEKLVIMGNWLDVQLDVQLMLDMFVLLLLELPLYVN